MIIEFWEQIDSNRNLIGYSTISLHQFYLAFRNPDIVTYLDRNQLPVIGSDWWEPITDPDTKELRGQAQILVALGSQIQIDTLLSERGFAEFNVKLPKYEKLKSQTKCQKVTCFKTSSKIDVGVQSESNNMNDKIKENDNNTHSTQNMLGLLLSQLIDQTARNNQNHITTIENRICGTNDIVPSTDKTDSTVQPKPISTVELIDSVQTALSIPPILDYPNIQILCNTFDAHIVIERALHLPTRRKCKVKKNVRGKCTKTADEVLMPSTYVTFETTPNGQPLVTHIVQKSASPEWNWNADVKLPVNLLTNNQKRIIFKVWKKNNNAYMQPNMNLDTIIGFASLDLTVLLAGLPTIEGWFNIIDFSSKCHGQINIIIKPLESISKFNKSRGSTTCTSTSCEPSPNGCGGELMQMDQEPGEMLNRALKRKFTELDEITQRLRSRLSDVVSDTECLDSESDISNDAFAEQFERDINTLSMEGDYGRVEFSQQAKLVQLQQVSQTLREIQLKEIESNQRVLSIAADPSESSCLLMAMGDGTSQDSSTSSLKTVSSIKTVAQPVILLKDLDKELVQGKQRIDSLLYKLTLMSHVDANRHVSGCSVSDLEGSNTTLTDSTEISSRALDARRSRANESTTTLKSELSDTVSEKLIEQCRSLPDGEGSSTDT